jgi:DNA-binding PadR family transcriptional regulator
MAMSRESLPSDHIPVHPLEFQALLVLMEDNLHGYGIAKEIERRETGLGKILPTNLYRRLRDLVAKGLISEASGTDEGNRKLFSITPFGREVARAEAQRLAALVRMARRHSLLPSGQGEA